MTHEKADGGFFDRIFGSSSPKHQLSPSKISNEKKNEANDISDAILKKYDVNKDGTLNEE